MTAKEKRSRAFWSALNTTAYFSLFTFVALYIAREYFNADNIVGKSYALASFVSLLYIVFVLGRAYDSVIKDIRRGRRG